MVKSTRIPKSGKNENPRRNLGVILLGLKWGAGRFQKKNVPLLFSWVLVSKIEQKDWEIWKFIKEGGGPLSFLVWLRLEGNGFNCSDFEWNTRRIKNIEKECCVWRPSLQCCQPIGRSAARCPRVDGAEIVDEEITSCFPKNGGSAAYAFFPFSPLSRPWMFPWNILTLHLVNSIVGKIINWLVIELYSCCWYFLELCLLALKSHLRWVSLWASGGLNLQPTSL